MLAARATRSSSEMRRVPGVVSVGRTDIGVATANNSNTGVQVPGSARAGRRSASYAVDTGFFETMGMKLLAGRLFDESRPADDIDTPFPGGPGGGARAGGARRQYRHQRAGGASGWASASRAGGRQAGQAALVDEEYRRACR